MHLNKHMHVHTLPLQFEDIVKKFQEVLDIVCDIDALRDVVDGPLYVNVTAISEAMCSKAVTDWYNNLKAAGFVRSDISRLAFKVCCRQ